MGLKLLRKVLDTNYIIQRYKGEVLIGSGHVSELVVIGIDMSIRYGSSFKGTRVRQVHDRLKELAADGELETILASKDEFDNLIDVWTFGDGGVTRKQCEETGWPNTTTDGELIYDNTFFRTRKEALYACRRDIYYGLKWGIEGLIRQLGKCRADAGRVFILLLKAFRAFAIMGI